MQMCAHSARIPIFIFLPFFPSVEGGFIINSIYIKLLICLCSIPFFYWLCMSACTNSPCLFSQRRCIWRERTGGFSSWACNWSKAGLAFYFLFFIFFYTETMLVVRQLVYYWYSLENVFFD